MKIGIDVSHHNDIAYSECGVDFFMIKATEGATYTDPQLNNFMSGIASSRAISSCLPIIGFYHYAHPEKNGAAKEAAHFIKTIEPHIGSCLVALDFEGDASMWKNIDKRAKWIDDFNAVIIRETGTIPFLYMSASDYSKHDSELKIPHRYWIAHHNAVRPRFTPPNGGNYIHQFCGTKIDVNIWTGSWADLAACVH